MQVFMEINGLDITGDIREDGITQSEFTRASREVVTLSGYSERSDVRKRAISVRLLERRDSRWYEICAALRTRPVTVRYIDDTTGNATKQFYVTSLSASAKRVMGGNTYFSGGSFTLEEV